MASKVLTTEEREKRRKSQLDSHWRHRDKRIAKLRERYAGDPEHFKQQAKEYRKKYPERVREAHLKCNYGITIADYDRILLAQGGGCAVCGSLTPGRKRDKYFCVDHCHETGSVRGLLCMPCNFLLGRYGDRIEQLTRFLDYLKRPTTVGIDQVQAIQSA